MPGFRVSGKVRGKKFLLKSQGKSGNFVDGLNALFLKQDFCEDFILTRCALHLKKNMSWNVRERQGKAAWKSQGISLALAARNPDVK